MKNSVRKNIELELQDLNNKTTEEVYKNSRDITVPRKYQDI